MNKRSILIKLFSIAIAAAVVFTALPAFAAGKKAPSAENTAERTQLGPAEDEPDVGPGSRADFEPSQLLPYDGERYVFTREDNRQRGMRDDYSYVRVRITVGSTNKIDLSFAGGYYIDQNLAPIIGTEDAPKKLTFTASSGKVKVTSGSDVLYTGAVVDLNRTNMAEEGGYSILTTAANSSNSGRKYLGNMRVSVNSDGTIRLINTIPTAHYLYGIVPYELSESSPLEALKALAVTAKTYAFGFTLAGDDYDITDSFTYQGYRGYKPGYTKCMLACLSVRGKILMNNNSVPIVFYGATNGGETALPSHMTGYTHVDYLFEVKLDDVDISEGASRRQTLTIEYNKSIANAAFKSLVEREAGKVAGQTVEALYITSAEVNTPAYEGCVRNLTQLKLTVRVKANGAERNITCSFPTKYLKDCGIFNKNYRIYWGSAVSGGYEVYFCRHGHGVGLSQLGAVGYAKLGYDYKYILNFYFSKMNQVDVTEANPETPVITTQNVLAFGAINESVVRLRSGPSTSSAILDRLTLGTHVDIIGEDSDWLICNVNGLIGYVRGDLIDIKLVPSPNGAQQSIGKANVLTLSNGATPVARVGPSVYCSEAFNLTPGAEIELWSKIGSWYHARINGAFAFVSSSSVSTPVWTATKLHRRLVP
ncbi:MAG: SpoIID/LytB domain-containing protein [Clostridia bacterium]|nr:SpoIID/LytB domain-containing protein [Clostridia bacterium]